MQGFRVGSVSFFIIVQLTLVANQALLGSFSAPQAHITYPPPVHLNMTTPHFPRGYVSCVFLP